MFDQIPTSRPNTPLLDTVDCPEQLKLLSEEQLSALAEELRAYLLFSVGQTGGHFGAGLGVVELTIALHYIYNTPEDRIVWDVGHQTYPHKILTGRREQMQTMRMQDGLAAFPKREESEYDTFGVGHSSTSISAALGMALAAQQQGVDRKVVAVIGDGAMTAGMAYEALHHAAHNRANMLVIVNDNQMSISHNTGGLGTYFAKIWASKGYIALREGSKKVLSRIQPAWDFAKRTEEYMKGMVSPGVLFEELGFNYIGPIDGHDLPSLLQTLENMRELKGPQLLHVMTKKGKGFSPAEEDPVSYHALNKIEAKPKLGETFETLPAKPKYQQVFGDWLCDMAEADERLIAITPAMSEGSGMIEFEQRFPERFQDVAIAEQHAVTLAAGMACEGLKPVVAIYSTFLQRGYDQLIHDVALQNLDVTFGIDRAGLVGEDGPTHAGSFDLSYLRCIPNMMVMAPSDENETRQLLYTGFNYPGPAAIRYPRGKGTGVEIQSKMTALEIGKGRIVREGKGVAILNFGTLLPAGLNAANALNASLADMRFVKPLDKDLIRNLAESHELLVTLEENAIAGGAGAAVNEYLAELNLSTSVLNLGLPDSFIDHGKHEDMLTACGLDSEGVLNSIRQRLDSSLRGKDDGELVIPA
jgi:1-deoxy-D-xylulose-5-phosphate synthase